MKTKMYVSSKSRFSNIALILGVVVILSGVPIFFIDSKVGWGLFLLGGFLIFIGILDRFWYRLKGK